MIVIGKRKDLKGRIFKQLMHIIGQMPDDRLLWEAIWFSSWNVLLSKEDKAFVAKGDSWVNRLYHYHPNRGNCDKHYKLVIAQSVLLTDLRETIQRLGKYVESGGLLLITVKLNLNDIMSKIYESIPLNEFKLYNSYYNDCNYNNDKGDFCTAGICLTKLFTSSYINKNNYVISATDCNYITQRMDLPEGHFLYSLYPDAMRKIYLPLQVYCQKIDLDVLKKIYNCSEKDAISLWNDLYMMQLIKHENAN